MKNVAHTNLQNPCAQQQVSNVHHKFFSEITRYGILHASKTQYSIFVVS